MSKYNAMVVTCDRCQKLMVKDNREGYAIFTCKTCDKAVRINLMNLTKT
jgi:DNA-directed RNA polymerase subunit M/transcription elongation factor TFIIS